MNTSTTSFKQLIVWQKAHQLVLEIYKMTEKFPSSEMYGLTSQIRRASVSVAANIVEGYRKKTPKDKYKFMNISQGSLDETHYYLILCHDLGYHNSESLIIRLEEIKRILDASAIIKNPTK
jgi:four helix bundle protein